MMHTRTPRALPRIGTALGTALALLALTGPPAHAAGTVGSSLAGEGLHIATGTLVDPNGRTWVADHNGGFCRMSPATETRAGQIEHPQRPGEPGLRTCLGGLLPDAGLGPDAAGQPVLVDPTPHFPKNGDAVALIPDGASPSSEVVRAQWNPDSGLFQYRDTISMLADRGRPTTLSLGPDGNVYVGFQRETTIQRIRDAASATPTVEIVGSTLNEDAAQSLAAGRDAAGALAVYVSEPTGVRVLHPVDGAVRTTEAAPFTLDPLPAVGAMHYDLATDHLYLGTANGLTQADAGTDNVIRINTRDNAVDATYATGFSMVGGIGTAPEGHLYVVDDPALLDPAEPLGTGRLFHAGLPAAHVTAGPLDDAGKTGRERNTADRTPSFTVTGDGAVECLLRGPGVDTGWRACGATYTVPQALADGEHTLSVRAQGGKPEALRFTVDTAAPKAPVIERPGTGTTVSGSPWFQFLSEPGVEYACALEGSATFEPCSPGREFTFEAGEHRLQIVATDRAGNRSEPSAVATFTVDPTLVPEAEFPWGAGPPSHRGSSLFTSGLHIATGAIVDPNGRTWVADHNGGFCRVTQPGEDGAGAIEHPSLPGDDAERTCLGGLLPEAGTGPDAAGQPAFVDPTPDMPGSGDEMALIPDGASPSSDVVRARWNPDSGLFEFAGVVTMIGDRIRPVAASLGPDGAVYVVFQKSGTVQRIADPAGDFSVAVVGNLAGRGAEGVAAGRDAEGRLTVYVAEAGAVTQVEPNAQTQPDAEASPFAVDAATPAAALAYDLKRDDLYVGTAAGTVEGADVVHRFPTRGGEAEREFVAGYSMIGGLSVRPDGVLYVLDDPALLDANEPLGTGRMFHVGLPAAHVAADAKAFVDTARPEFAVTGEENVECRLRGPEGLDTGWAACATDRPWAPAQDLAEGAHVLTVRSVEYPPAPETAVEGEPVEGEPVVTPQPATPIVGLVEAHRFTVDTVDPEQPAITGPSEGARVNGTPWFTFDAEADVAFECRWDGALAWIPCAPGNTRPFTVDGEHSLVIRAVDRAGNVSPESVARTFVVRSTIGTVTITGGPGRVTRDAAPVFTFAADAEDVEFACRLDRQAFTACTSPKAYSGLADGDHTFEVQGRDAVGNVSPVISRRFRVDRTAPVITTPGLDEGAVTGPAVSLPVGLDEVAALSCTIDAGTVVECGTTVRLSGLPAGERVLSLTATDAAGNVRTLERRFVVEIPLSATGEPLADAPETVIVAPVPPVTPPAPVTPVPPAPSVTVVDQATGETLTVRLADIDRRVDLEKLQEAGVTVEVIPAQGTKLIRFRIFKLSGNGRNRGGRQLLAAGPRRTVVATIYRRVQPGRSSITLTRRELRRVTAGRYVLEVTPGVSRSRLGKAKTAAFTVTR
jgi:hypothetical protein